MYKVLPVIVFTFFICCSVNGQKGVLLVPVDSARIKLLFETYRLYYNKANQSTESHFLYLDSAIDLMKRSLPVSESLHMDHLSSEISWRLAVAVLLKGHIPEGKKWVTKAVAGSRLQGNDLEEANTLSTIASATSPTPKLMPYLDSILQRAMTVYDQKKLLVKYASTLNTTAFYHSLLLMYEKSEQEYAKLIQMYRLLKINKISTIYLALSQLNRYKGNFDRSISYALKSLQQTEQGKDTIPLSSLYGELALVYDGLGQVKQSIIWYRKALVEREKLVGSQGYLFVFRTAGFLIQQLIKNEQQEEALSIMINLSKKYPTNDELTRSMIAQNLGYCYEALKKYNAAEQQYLDMIKQGDNSGYLFWNKYDEFKSIAYKAIGGFYIRRHQYAKATPYLEEAIKFFPGSIPMVMRRDLELMLFTADSATGKYLSAIKHYGQYNLIKDSLFNDTKSKQIEEIQIRYETEKKEKEIILLNEQRKSQENQIQKSAIIRNFVILGIVLLGSFFYYRYSLKQRSNHQLQLQQVEINQKNKTLQSLVNEKEWLLREIHHRVKNNLQVIMALLESQSTYLEKNSPALKAIQDSQHRVHSMSLIHKKLYKSDNVSTMNMLVYIHELVDYLRDSFHIEQRIYFEIDVDKIEMDISQAVPLGLMMNEAITNSIKYAFPGIKDARLSISMKEIAKNNFLLQISDNGIGFPDNVNLSKPESLGLSLMKGLSEEIEGSFSIESDHGTTIKIYFSPNEQLLHSTSHQIPSPVSENALI